MKTKDMYIGQKVISPNTLVEYYTVEAILRGELVNVKAEGEGKEYTENASLFSPYKEK